MSGASATTPETVTIAWERRGSGAPLLLVQGLGFDRSGWGPATDRLAERFEVLVFDNRGIGESDAPPGPYSVEMLASDAFQVLDEAGIERAHVAGASLGGMVAQHLAAVHPDRVDRLVLICTTPGGELALPVPEQTLALLAEAPSLDRATAIAKFTRNALSPSAPGELVAHLVSLRLRKLQPVEAWYAQAAAGAAFDGSAQLDRIAAPTLVLHGSADNVVDVRTAQVLGERIGDARVEIFDGLGHMFWWEAPEKFVAVVSEFLS